MHPVEWMYSVGYDNGEDDMCFFQCTIGQGVQKGQKKLTLIRFASEKTDVESES